MRRPISVTLDEENLLWLRAVAVASAQGNLSRALDRILREARLARRADVGGGRSVQGTIGPVPDDSELEKAAEEIRAMFESSASRALVARERPPVAARRAARRRG
jgi:hypothetical protein